MEGSMKKAIFVFISVIMLSPLIAGAVTWTMDSNPFTFPNAGIIGNPQSQHSGTTLRWRFDSTQGIIAFNYDLPSIPKGTTLNVYTAGGILVRGFDLQPGSSLVEWNISESKLAAGVYIASVRCENIDHRIKFSIVK
jgi:hypothetical protein